MSVVLPVYNEAHNLPAVLRSLYEQRGEQGPLDKSLYEVVLVDNNSTDDTVKIARRFAAEHPDLALHVVPEPEQGVACARRTGHGLRVTAQRPARTLRRRAAVLPRLGRRRLPRGRALAVGAVHRDGVGQGRHRRLRLLLRARALHRTSAAVGRHPADAALPCGDVRAVRRLSRTAKASRSTGTRTTRSVASRSSTSFRTGSSSTTCPTTGTSASASAASGEDIAYVPRSRVEINPRRVNHAIDEVITGRAYGSRRHHRHARHPPAPATPRDRTT